MLKEIFKNVFYKEKWETIYFTDSIDEYYRIKGKLTDGNIQAKTNNISSGAAGRGMGGYQENPVSYEILVKQSDVHKAYEIIHT